MMTTRHNWFLANSNRIMSSVSEMLKYENKENVHLKIDEIEQVMKTILILDLNLGFSGTRNPGTELWQWIQSNHPWQSLTL